MERLHFIQFQGRIIRQLKHMKRKLMIAGLEAAAEYVLAA